MSDYSNNNSDYQVFLVNILNIMYNDNIRQIQYLNDANNEIRNTIISLLNPELNNRINYITSGNNTNNNNNNNNNRNNSQQVNTRNTRNTNTQRLNNRNISPNLNNSNVHRRVTINNIPYIIDNVQRYDIQNNFFDRYFNVSQHSFSSTPQLRDDSQRQINNLTTILDSFFNPVVIYPTQSQIELATRNVKYCDIVTPINRSCPISLENFNDNDIVTVIRFCGHIFNTEELNRWFTTNCKCPVCRYDIRNYNSSSSLNNYNIQPDRESTEELQNNEIDSFETNNEERNNETNTSLNNYYYNFITSDISVNNIS